MPELPEVEALAGFLREKAVGRTVTRVDVVAVSALKTYQPDVSALTGSPMTAVARHGKFLDFTIGDWHLVVHLARAGWLRWSEQLTAASPRPGRGPLALRVHLGGAGFDLTEAGTRKGLAAYLVADPNEVPGVASLGVDPLAPEFELSVLEGILGGDRGQLKGVLRDQGKLAGIGNAYSDEILHAARMSPFKPAGKLSVEETHRLFEAIQSVLREAVARAGGLAAAELKDDKRAGMRVHGRTGQPCPVCGDRIREVSFADSSLQYCPTCQTGGQPLADRRLSKLLR